MQRNPEEQRAAHPPLFIPLCGSLTPGERGHLWGWPELQTQGPWAGARGWTRAVPSLVVPCSLPLSPHYFTLLPLVPSSG